MRRLVADVLRSEGHAVDGPVDSYVALERARSERYDLIALNDEMPLLDGLAFLEVLREAGIDTPIVLLSDQSQDPDLATLEAFGVHHVIRKPFPVRRLLEVVGEILPP